MRLRNISGYYKYLCIVGCVFVLDVPVTRGYESKQGRVFISESDQQRELDGYHIDCLTRILYDRPRPGDITTGVTCEAGDAYSFGTPDVTVIVCVYCNRTWDGIACWPHTEPGSDAEISCPDYVHGFYVKNMATKRCMADGRWFVHPGYNQSWTNYSACYDQDVIAPTAADVPELIKVHMGNIRVMYNTGYGISLVSLSLAVFVMVYFKKLHCPRNTVHVNLFVSFILRATLSFLKETLLVQGLGLKQDVEQTPYDTVLFITEGSHWECKLLFTAFYYVLSASYMWIFVEGIHLHTLIKVSVFSERSSIKYYIILGWGLPFLYIIPWVIVRITLENILCWNTNPTPEYYWIIKGPLVLSIAINFILFLNILKALFSNMKSPKSQSAKKHKYRRLAKATLVLIPLFGVHYIVFIGFPDELEPETEVVKLYFEMFFNSFQGLVVAVLFCFMNGEVQMELLKRVCRKRAYRRYRRYYRASMNPNTTKCVCQCHRRETGPTHRATLYESDGVQTRYSEGLSYSAKRMTKQCVCKWHVELNDHVLKYNSTMNKNGGFIHYEVSTQDHSV